MWWRGGAAPPLPAPSPLPSPHHFPPPPCAKGNELPGRGVSIWPPPGGPHERHTAAALYNVPAPGSQPPAPGRAGFTTFKADSHFAAEMGSRRARQLQPVGGDGAPVADMLLVDELSMALSLIHI